MRLRILIGFFIFVLVDNTDFLFFFSFGEINSTAPVQKHAKIVPSLTGKGAKKTALKSVNNYFRVGRLKVIWKNNEYVPGTREIENDPRSRRDVTHRTDKVYR